MVRRRWGFAMSQKFIYFNFLSKKRCSFSCLNHILCQFTLLHILYIFHFYWQLICLSYKVPLLCNIIISSLPQLSFCRSRAVLHAELWYQFVLKHVYPAALGEHYYSEAQSHLYHLEVTGRLRRFNVSHKGICIYRSNFPKRYLFF